MIIPISEPNISLLTWKKLPDPSQLFFHLPESLVSDLLKRSNHKWLEKPNEIGQETVNKNLDCYGDRLKSGNFYLSLPPELVDYLDKKSLLV